MINQVICIDLQDNLLCLIRCHLNGVHVREVPNFLADNPNETTHAIEIVDPFNATHPLIILLQLSSVTSYFDVYFPTWKNMRMKTFQRFISLLKNLHMIC